jgi:hypothetical protein
MNKILFCGLFTAILTLVSCNQIESPNENRETFWIFTSEIPCDLMDTTRRCIFKLDKNELDYDLKNWTPLEQGTELVNFDYEAGFFYQITVDKGKTETPFYLHVVKVNKKVKDYLSVLHGTWDLKKIKKLTLPTEKSEDYFLSIESWMRKIYVIADCVFYMGQAGEVSSNKFSSLPISPYYTSTNSTCDQLDFPNTYLSSKKYTLINNETLIFMDQNSDTTLVLKKVLVPNPYNQPKAP